VVRTLSRILFFNPGRAIECQIKNDMFHKLMALQKDYYDKNPSGGIISKVNNDIMGIRMIYGFAMMQAFNIATMLSLTPLKMWQLSPKLTLYCILPIIVVFAIVRLGMRVLVRNMRARMQALQRLSAFSAASLSGIDVIKSYEMPPWALGRFGVESEEMVTRALRISWVRSFMMPILSNLEHLLKLLILLVGGMLVIQENLSLGQLTAFITYAVLLTMPLMALGWVTTMIQQGLVGLESVRTVLAEKDLALNWDTDYPLCLEIADATLIASVNGNVVFEHTDADRPLLSGSVALVCTPGRVDFGMVSVQGRR